MFDEQNSQKLICALEKDAYFTQILSFHEKYALLQSNLLYFNYKKTIK